MQQPRNHYMDNIKGILIFLVVYAHFLLFYVEEGTASTFARFLTYFIYSFHMPLFVFVSGYFSKDVDKVRATAFERLLVPYLIFNTLMLIAVSLSEPGKYEFGYLTPVFVNWFILALFFWRIFLKDLVRLKYILPISFLVAFFIGYVPDVTNYLALARTLAFFPFFLMGYYADGETLRKIRSFNKPLVLCGLTVFGVIAYMIADSGTLPITLFIAAPYQTPFDPMARIIFFLFAMMVGTSILCLCPNRKMWFITASGEQTLLIFLLHRYITFLFYEFLPPEAWSRWHLLTTFVLSLLTVAILGGKRLSRAYHTMMEWVLGGIIPGRKSMLPRTAFPRAVSGFLVILLLPLLYCAATVDHKTSIGEADSIHPVLSGEDHQLLESSVTISFVGDLILLENQVKRAWDPDAETYDFRPVFEYAAEDIQRADLAIGVLEVPLAGEAAGYSTSNYDDGIPLALNGPDTWAVAAKNSGIDLVTTATNHALDKGIAGLHRTLDVLEQIGLPQVGTYRNARERREIPIHEVRGIKIAFLAYTYGLNHSAEALLSSKRHLVGILADPCRISEFQASLEMVREDIRLAKKHRPDVIIALPHMGKQFSHEADMFSRIWAERMLEEGVDVVLANHSHAVQPIELPRISGNESKAEYGMIAYCPGNFVNEYTDKNGDASAIINLHLSNREGEKGRVLGASIVPMWIQHPIDGQSRPIPLHRAVSAPAIRAQLCRREWNRIEEVHQLVSKVMLGSTLGIDQIQERYYLLPEHGYVRAPGPVSAPKTVESVPLDENRRRFYQALCEAETTLFLGDSITEGTKNGGYGWFEPLAGWFPGNRLINRGVGGETTKTLLSHLEIDLREEADLIVLSVGTNDVRYRTSSICSMTSQEYVANMKRIVREIRKRRPEARIAIINAWLAYWNDPYAVRGEKSRDARIDNYNAALESFCAKNDLIFIDANTPIKRFLEKHVTNDFILDHIHPNAGRGIQLYSHAVLFGDPEPGTFQ